jgi:hypothetical protein
MYIPESMFNLLHLPEYILEFIWDAYWDNEWLRMQRLFKEGKI